MQYALLIDEDEVPDGPGKNSQALPEIVSRHMAFNREFGAKRVGGLIRRHGSIRSPCAPRWMGSGGVEHTRVLNPNCRRSSTPNHRMSVTTL